MTQPHIETLLKPSEYSEAQIALACAVHEILQRGTLVLVEPPRKP